ncbi:MAG TPA: TetR/AcrR family transcriptional regulator C-terminal domain-containing protein [Streptosporangiaceae bacterium]
MSHDEPNFDIIWPREAPAAPQPGKPPLTREQIVAAAIELADEDGIDALSIRRIATKLGVGATTLYWHIKNKDDLFSLMYDSTTAEIELPEPTGDWRADLRTVALRTHESHARHRWIILLGIQPSIGPSLRRYAEFIDRVLAPLGLDRQARTDTIAIVNDYISGFAHRETAWERLRERAGLTGDQWHERLDSYLAQARATDPEFAAMIQSRLHLTSQENFELGLDCVLDGIASRIAG